MICKGVGSRSPRFLYRMYRRKGATEMAGKFEVYQDKQDKYRWRLKAGNGEIIAASEAYNSKAGALNGVESVRTNAPGAALDDQTS
jgi:hypothetical protein